MGMEYHGWVVLATSSSNWDDGDFEGAFDHIRQLLARLPVDEGHSGLLPDGSVLPRTGSPNSLRTCRASGNALPLRFPSREVVKTNRIVVRQCLRICAYGRSCPSCARPVDAADRWSCPRNAVQVGRCCGADTQTKGLQADGVPVPVGRAQAAHVARSRPDRLLARPDGQGTPGAAETGPGKQTMINSATVPPAVLKDHGQGGTVAMPSSDHTRVCHEYGRQRFALDYTPGSP